MPRKTPNSAALPTIADAQRIRTAITPPAAIAPAMPRGAVPGLVGYVGRAVSAVSANSSGQFKVQEQTPGFLEDSQLKLEAYTLADIPAGQAVYLAWVATHTIGGGYWLALASSSSLCFEPCDLFELLDSLQLDSDAQARLNAMKAGCGCSLPEGPCPNCPETPVDFNVALLDVVASSGVTLFGSNFVQDNFLKVDISTFQLQSIINEVLIPVSQLGTGNLCWWTGQQSVTRSLIVESVYGAIPDGVPGTYNFTFRFSAFVNLANQNTTVNVTIDDISSDFDLLYDGVFGGIPVWEGLEPAFNQAESFGCERLVPISTSPPIGVNQDNSAFDLTNANIFFDFGATPVAFPVEPTPLTDYLNKTYFYDPDEVASGLDLPLPSNPSDGDFVRVVFGGTIPSGSLVVNELTFTNGTVHSAAGAASSGDAITLQYRAANDRWYIV